MQEKEFIRLVIWDLDETYWHGTLTEGGIREYVQAHHDTVIELAKRGIVSSICSKNDFEPVEAILKEQGIWDYFVFPSIDWTPKGARLKQLIEDIQLRPESVLFIDDNASNRAEAAAHVPGLQIADESIIATLLTHELLQGKDDVELTRLKQYQLLQRRKVDEKASGSDNTAFLRSSNIRVIIEPNVKLHLGRAIELINRTNQLNFTKLRLPDDKELAVKELTGVVNRYFMQAGLIRVVDNYGDYGYCGLYVTFALHDVNKLVHFCFSCRVLGMGIERWLYQKLGRPSIQVEKEVKTDFFPEENIDWINQDVNGALLFADSDGKLDLPAPETISQFLAPEIRMRGGCEIDALSHYLRQETHHLVTQTNYPARALLIRLDTTNSMALSLSPLNEAVKNELSALDFNANDFDGQIFASPPPGTLFVISAWGDMYLPRYRHRTLNIEVEVAFQFPGLLDLTRISSEQLEHFFVHNESAVRYFTEERKDQMRRIIRHLAENYYYAGFITEMVLRRDWTTIFESIPQNCYAAILLPSCYRGTETAKAHQYHAIVKDIARHYPHVMIFDVTKHLTRQEDLQDAVDHFDRMVYFSIYKEMVQEFGKKLAANGQNTVTNVIA